jgi:hypothetical protein
MDEEIGLIRAYRWTFVHFRLNGTQRLRSSSPQLQVPADSQVNHQVSGSPGSLKIAG